MNTPDLSRLHALRMENTQRGYDMAEMRPRFDRLKTRHEDGTAPQAIAVHQLFQTPPPLAERLAGMLGMAAGARILEPSAGLGRLLDALAPFEPSEIVAVEKAQECAKELFRQNRDGVTLKQRDFLTLSPAETGLFDAVAMNPPFTMRADIRHILHALAFLKPGGILAALCMDTRHREEALRGISDHWEHIPAGTFAQEGTRIACVLLTIKKA